MKKYLLFILILFGIKQELFSQVKKTPVKKTAVPAKPKTTAITKSPVTKTSPAAKKPAVVNKKPVAITKPTDKKPISIVLPNKPVNNSEITVVALTSREQEMVNEINTVRSNPARYCAYVDEYLQKYQSDDAARAAAKELVGILKKMKPLPPLTVNTTMYKDAKLYGISMAKRNVFEHSSLPYYENLSLGYKSVRDAVVDLLIDDGIPDRGHRNNLLNEKIRDVAVYEVEGKVQNIGYCYVQVFK